jgi:hypothetical protein
MQNCKTQLVTRNALKLIYSDVENPNFPGGGTLRPAPERRPRLTRQEGVGKERGRRGWDGKGRERGGPF